MQVFDVATKWSKSIYADAGYVWIIKFQLWYPVAQELYILTVSCWITDALQASCGKGPKQKQKTVYVQEFVYVTQLPSHTCALKLTCFMVVWIEEGKVEKPVTIALSAESAGVMSNPDVVTFGVIVQEYS